MNRRILLQVTGPALVLGLFLLGTCLVAAWYISRLQANLATIMSETVASLTAAQDLEIRVRQLRFRSFLDLIDPSPARQSAIHEAQERFEGSLRKVRIAARSPEEQRVVQTIEAAYERYRTELAHLRAEVARAGTQVNLGKLADDHPVAHVVNACQDLLQLNKESMEQTALESNRVSTQAQLALLFVGLAGPAGGIIIGYGVARGLARSIYQLSVRVQNMAQRLDQDVASVKIATDGDLHNLDQQLQYVVQRVEEVAERIQQQQRELLRAEQLSAVGQLGASVAHEIRNPLTGIKMLVDAALRPQNDKPLTHEDLEVIRREITRLEQTVQGLLNFARLPAPQRVFFDLGEVVTQANDLIRTRARQQGVEVMIRAADQPVPVHADKGQLHTVLVNLLLNALDAMPQGGRLEIALEQVLGKQVRLTVADTGSGIAPEMASRLFTPFASSKPTGTGLGLSISQRILAEHGGQIAAENRSQGGTAFVITLPLAPSRKDEG
jgi:signal transduction histidine kinase